MNIAAVVYAGLAVFFWSFTSFLGARLGHIPPFLLTGLGFCISGLTGLVIFRTWRVPLRTLLVGVFGIFGYHFLLFLSLRMAPAIEVNLLYNLWPVLIVLMSPLFLPGYRLRWYHWLGILGGFAGAFLIVTGGRFQLNMHFLPGYLVALAAALVWTTYTLTTKRLPPFPTAAISVFCLVSGICSLLVHYLLFAHETAVSMQTTDWLLLLCLGLGPLGASFFCWDASIKKGDPRIAAALAYLTPMTSTLVLVVFAGQPFGWIHSLSMVLIVGGAVLGSLDIFHKPARASVDA